ncbi:helix-turn-helix domain-containing protein [Microbispora hainanensis]|uniref:Helix-turn-helix domain-containing protein n=1 Tax=Microbispora hainanensis TaxID=568844 RepID=A0ABZ1SJ58_9ACTN|nr:MULTISPECIES: helix-turn-helix domain-containing protein [Microbispora]NJP27829.1 helix-turn-helix domain-containing protein [Microbispora sp. CL1-1]TQS10596.1 helix-turn-helix domain-containing protein [Microbispora sp. SCL1-1]
MTRKEGTLTAEADRLWSVEEVSRFLGVPVATVYQWRYLGVGPKGHKVGRHVRYIPADVLSWVREQP